MGRICVGLCLLTLFALLRATSREPRSTRARPPNLDRSAAPIDRTQAAARVVRGRVLDYESEKPCAGAEVRAYATRPGLADWPVRPLETTRAGLDGAFEIQLPCDGPIWLLAHASGQADRAAEAEDGMCLFLHKAEEFEFTVVDEDHRPVAGAEALLVPSSDSPVPAHRVRTGADGRVRVTACDADLVVVRATGFAAGRWDPDSPAPLLVLVAGFGILGTVVDAEGEPLEGASVEITDDFYWPWVNHTGSDGRFELGHVPGREVELTVEKEGYARVERDVVPGRGGLEIRLLPGADLTGTVLLPDGSPGRAKVTATWLDSGVEVASTWPDGSGRFEFDPLPVGRYRLEARTRTTRAIEAPVGSDTRLEVLSRAEETVWLDGGAEVVLRLAADPTCSFVRVRAVDADGEPLAGLELKPFARTDDSGLAVCAFALPPETPVRVRHRAKWEDEPHPLSCSVLACTSASPFGEEVALRAPRPLHVLMRVTDLAGEPLPFDHLWISPAEGWVERKSPDALEAWFVSTAPDGWSYTVGASGCLTQNRDRIPLPANDSEIVVRLRRGTTVKGRLVEADGQPIEDASVIVRQMRRGGEGYGLDSTEADGSFRVEGLEAGRAFVTIARDESEIVGLLRDITVPAQGEVELGELSLGTPPVLRGRVVDGAGEPVAGAIIRFPDDENDRPEPHRQTLSRGDGSFMLRIPDPPPSHVLAIHDGFATAARWFDPADLGEPVVLALRPACRLEIAIEPAALPTPWTRFALRVESLPEGLTLASAVKKSSRLRHVFDALPPGVHRLTFAARDSTSWYRESEPVVLELLLEPDRACRVTLREPTPADAARRTPR